MTLLPRKNEFHNIQMEKFAIQAYDTTENKRNLQIQEAGEELRRKEDSHDRLVNYLETDCRINIWTHHLDNASDV